MIDAYGGGGGSGYVNFSNIGGYYSSSPYWQASAVSMPTYFPVTCSGGSYTSEPEIIDKPQKISFKLENMSDWKKEKMREVLHKFIKEYQFQRGVDDMTKGLKWLLFFLGFAILLNFGTILDIISKVVGAG